MGRGRAQRGAEMRPSRELARCVSSVHQLFRALVQRWLHITGSPSLQLKSPGTCHMGSTQESWWVPSPSQVPPPPPYPAAFGRGGPLGAIAAPRASRGAPPRPDPPHHTPPHHTPAPPLPTPHPPGSRGMGGGTEREICIPPSVALSQPVGGHSDFIQGTPGTSDKSCMWDTTQVLGDSRGNGHSLYFSL